MKRFLSFCLSALLACLVLAGCTYNDASENRPPAETPSMVSVSEWPDNPYTKAIPKPEVGTPDYVIDGNDSFYAIFLKDLTLEQGKQYLEALKADGFEPVAGDGNQVAVGELLQKDGVCLGISISENILGIYISLTADG